MSAPPDDVCITLDLDWAADEVLRGALDLVRELDVPVTLFCTHSTGLVHGLDPERFEIAWHPNFLADRDEGDVLDELARLFPAAAGVRTHALYYHSRLVPRYLRRGIRYLAHDLCFLEAGLAPRTHWSGLVDVPGFWEDDVHALVFDGEFRVAQLGLERPGLKVFDFHPIHLALNTDRMSRYEAARPDIEAGRSLEAHVNPGRGSRTLLVELVERLRGDPARYRFATCVDVADAHARHHPYRGHYRAD